MALKHRKEYSSKHCGTTADSRIKKQIQNTSVNRAIRYVDLSSLAMVIYECHRIMITYMNKKILNSQT